MTNIAWSLKPDGTWVAETLDPGFYDYGGLYTSPYSVKQRTFAYGENLASEVETCGSEFVQSFHHVYWQDGISVVQAGETPNEEGFNSRFHKIEIDIAALGRDVAKNFSCLADLRSSLADRLAEIKTEINQINEDIAEALSSSRTWYGGPYFRNPGDLIETPSTPRPRPDNPSDPFGPDTGPYGPYGPYVNPGSIPWLSDYKKNRTPNFILGANAGNGMFMLDKGDALVKDNTGTKAFIGSMPAYLLEVTEIEGKPVEVWSTANGLIGAPAGEGASATPANWVNPRIEDVADFGLWAEKKSKAISRRLGREAFSIDTFLDAFGGAKLAGGRRVSDVFSGVSGDIMVKDANGLSDALIDATADAIVAEGTATETVIGIVGINSEVDKLSDVPLKKLKPASSRTHSALKNAGFATLGDLRGKTPAELAANTTGLSAASAGRMIAMATVIDAVTVKMAGVQ